MALTSRAREAWKALTGPPRVEARSTNDQFLLGLESWSDWSGLSMGGYPIGLGLNQTLSGHQEEIQDTFQGLIQQAYKYNGVVFACMLARLSLFTEARFQFQQLNNGRPGDLFGTQALGILEHPWPGGVTGDMLSRAIQYADLAGNAFIVQRPKRLAMPRPDWMTIVLGSMTDPDVVAGDLDAEVLGYIYHPGGHYSGRDIVPLMADEVAHFAPIPDPWATFRGMSWLTPIIRETMADSAATAHKLKFFENGATVNMVVTLDKDIGLEAFQKWIDEFEKGHKGAANAYKTLYLAGGATANPVGANFQQMDFKLTQGAGETRIAAASGMHPVIVGLSEGLAGSSLNAGNFNSARRLVADKTMWPLWRNLAGCLETIVPPPPSSRLWIDARDIPFLREDRKDAAEIENTKSTTIRTLVDAGFRADDVLKAVEAEDMGLLIGKHTGLFSVQLQAPGSTKMPQGETPGETPVGGGAGPEKPSINPAAVAKPKPPATANAGRALTALLDKEH